MTQVKSRFATIASTTLLASSLVLLTACGGGSSGTAATTTPDTTGGTTIADTSVKTGVFIDAPVKGLTYKTATQSGVTNDKGEFNYITGETVTFSLDGVELGSGKAQAKLPVTLISPGDTTYLAQLLQTMDTDANSDLIDVSKVKLDTTTKNGLKALIAHEGGCDTITIKCIETILDSATLTKIQADSQVALVNQTVVTEADAAKHVYQSVGSTPWQSSEVSGQTFATLEKSGYIEVATLKTDGTFSIYSYDSSDQSVENKSGTWQLNNGELLATFTIGDHGQYNLRKLSQDDNGIDFWPENTTDGGSSSFVTWNYTKPLTLAALDGKHLNFDMTGNDYCTAMTISFSGSTAIVRDKCNGQYEEGTGTLEAVTGVQNIVKISSGTQAMLLTMTSGDVNKGKMLRINIDGSTLEEIDASDFTAVSAPLQP
ncbi:hypothetical protein RCF98_06345 [Thiothrix lacustris]|uniref:Uncharacterized protein n=1 Tax=Thiothrix lacustris TaxID=525917 RepID=A0ABY9MUW6_9GAMM|nr:hypothetical protein [Thiothrix lacustris]WML91956.1 hypothetical protein RCF98_06345 [Thiothrix lacustris]